MMNLSRVRIASLAVLVLVVAHALLPALFAQARTAKRPGQFTEIKWEDYTFKFLPGNQMAQVIDANGHVIGTILDSGGELKLLPTVTGADAEKLTKSFQAWKDSGGEAALGYKPAKPALATAPATASPAKPGLTVDGVISMVQAGLSDDLIIEKIHKSGQSFDLSADDMVRLKNAKASDGVIKAMLEASPAAATATSNTASPSPTAASPSASSPVQPASPPPTNAASDNSAKPKSKSGIGSVFQGTSDIMHGRSVIDRVGLRNALPQWDPQKPLSQQFPHVAITVLYAPMGWMDPYMTDASAQGRSIVSHCFQLEAMVWSDAETSKKTPFEWCSNKDEFLDRLGPDYPYSLITHYREPGYGTGINRTEGPAPPDKMLPYDRATLDMEAKTNPHGQSIDLNRDYTSRFALMFANIRKDLGQTLTNDGDPRVWIVSIKKAAGPSIF
jgi:hypothetical protein